MIALVVTIVRRVRRVLADRRARRASHRVYSERLARSVYVGRWLR